MTSSKAQPMTEACFAKTPFLACHVSRKWISLSPSCRNETSEAHFLVVVSN